MKLAPALPLAACLFLFACDSAPPTNPSPDMGGDMMMVTTTGDCPEPTGAGTQHSGELTADETWTAAASPHIVTADVVVRGGHKLTIEECALVRVRGTSSIFIGANLTSDGTGELVAHGTYSEATGTAPEVLRPVAITSEDEISWWGSLQVLATGFADLQVVVIDHGGDPAQFQGGGGALLMRGDDNRTTPVRNVSAKALFVTNSATYGINMRTSAGFTADSAGIAILNSGSKGSVGGGEDTRYAVYAEAPALKTLPELLFMDNTKNEILAHAPFTVAVDERFPAQPVPYQIRNSFFISPSAAGTLTLTIDPGVTIKLGGPLASDPSFKLGDDSTHVVRLNAAGTAAKPILITSGAATPAPGDWNVIDWQGGPATGNVMSYVTVEYGGGESGANGFGCGPGDNDSLLLITGWAPSDEFIENCTFRHSAAGGIVCGWSSDLMMPTLLGNNTFSDIGNQCRISFPKSMSGVCPGNDSTADCR